MRGMKDRIPFAVNNITCVILLSLFCNAASAVEFNNDFLREQTGITLRRSQTRISARRAQAKECQRLEIPNLSPLLCVRTLNHRDGESSPAEYSVSLTRADMIEFTMEH